MRKRLVGIAAVVLFFSFGINTVLNAQDANIYKLHSLFMYNFTKHVQWAEVGETFTIGVYGNQLALNDVKTNFAGKKFSGKDFKVINIAGVGDINACQMVYFPKSNKNKILDLFESSDKKDVLFVSEDELIDQGIPVSFIISGTKLGFIVSKKNLDASGLKMSSSLLSLAQVVD